MGIRLCCGPMCSSADLVKVFCNGRPGTKEAELYTLPNRVEL